ncbi:MAG: lipoyl(octanoyl) transferase LipB [Bacteroidetes bacterium]|nr:MAG: lipoyl(octanoyl) transferase LipB [Bacteroidota bacterium]
MQKVKFEDLGLISYKKAWDYQSELHQALKDRKVEARRNKETLTAPTHHLLFCEHPPVYTLGKSGSEDNILLDEKQLEEQGFEYFKINRGGDITYHGPGQIVGYPIFDMDFFFTDVHKYVRYLEEAIIRTLKHYDIEAYRIKEYTGVWLPEKGFIPKRKICAIGVHLSRWVTLHGFAFNVKPRLNHFNNIIPCGINDADKAVTSLENELGEAVDMEEVKNLVKGHLAKLFEFETL